MVVWLEWEGLSGSSGHFHATIAELQKEAQLALESSAQKSQQVERLQHERAELQMRLTHRSDRSHRLMVRALPASNHQPSPVHSQDTCHQLRQQLTNQNEDHGQQLHSLRAELECEGGALRQRLEEMGERRREEQMQREGEEEHHQVDKCAIVPVF